jgi:hypothetical protein
MSAHTTSAQNYQEVLTLHDETSTSKSPDSDCIDPANFELPVTSNFPTEWLLESIASICDEMCRTNDMIQATTYSPPTKFHAVAAAPLSVLDYLHRIKRYSMCSDSCFVLLVIYLDHAYKLSNLVADSLSIHRLIISAMLLCCKFYEDKTHRNNVFAQIGGISTQEMNRLEVELLNALRFDLNVSHELFYQYESTLRLRYLQRHAKAIMNPYSTSLSSLANPYAPLTRSQSCHTPNLKHSIPLERSPGCISSDFEATSPAFSGRSTTSASTVSCAQSSPWPFIPTPNVHQCENYDIGAGNNAEGMLITTDTCMEPTKAWYGTEQTFETNLDLQPHHQHTLHLPIFVTSCWDYTHGTTITTTTNTTNIENETEIHYQHNDTSSVFVFGEEHVPLQTQHTTLWLSEMHDVGTPQEI